MYASDWDEWMPPSSAFSMGTEDEAKRLTGDQSGWKAALMPYLKQELSFYSMNWPFSKARSPYSNPPKVHVARGEIDGTASFGHVAQITPDLFGTQEGWLKLNLSSPPLDYLDRNGGSPSSAPLYEDLAWLTNDSFGKSEVTRSIPKKGGKRMRVVSSLDGGAREEPDQGG